MISYDYETHLMPDALIPFYVQDHTINSCNNPFNWHENIELLCATAGEGFVHCGGKVYPFKQGDIVVINADLIHAIDSESSVTYYCLIIDKTFCEKNGIVTSNFHFTELIRDETMCQAFTRIRQSYDRYQTTGEPVHATVVRYEVLGILCTLTQNYSTKIGEHGLPASEEWVKKVLVYIRARLTESFTLAEVAAYVGVSPYYLSRQFKKLTGKTIFEMLNLLRCTKARSLIEQGHRVSEAALSCGFDNLSYFTRTFKKHFGVCPSNLDRPA